MMRVPFPLILTFGTAFTMCAGSRTAAEAEAAGRLTPPESGRIPVAFVISNGATVIDFTGPWEVFQDVTVPGRGQAFELFTVAETADPVTVTGGMKIIPNYTFENAPRPRVIVVPALRSSPRLLGWVRETHGRADLTMSVCTGAFVLARAGLLAGRAATTHHDFLDRLAASFPDIEVRRGLRFVEGEKIATAGGLTSGIDLALRVVARYFGRDVAAKTATYMEYESEGWMRPEP